MYKNKKYWFDEEGIEVSIFFEVSVWEFGRDLKSGS